MQSVTDTEPGMATRGSSKPKPSGGTGVAQAVQAVPLRPPLLYAPVVVMPDPVAVHCPQLLPP